VSGEQSREPSPDDAPEEGLTRRRFVQLCVAGATVAAAGSTLTAILGKPSEVLGPAGPEAHESVAACPVCSVGCGLLAVSAGDALRPSSGDPLSTATKGMECARGAFPPAREWPATLAQPLARISELTKGSPAQESHFRTVAWDEALDDLAGRIVEAGQVFGRGAPSCLIDGGVPLEDCYVAARLWKGHLGSGSIDSVESLHTRAAEVAYTEQLGAPGPPTCHADLSLADLIVVIGEDIASTHPVLYSRVVEAVAGGAQLVVIDPRVTQTALRTNCLHLPLKAGGEVAFLNSVAFVIANELGAVPEAWTSAHVQNVGVYKEFVKLYDPTYDANGLIDPLTLTGASETDPAWVAGLGNRDAKNNLKTFNVPAATGLTTDQVKDLASRWAKARAVVTIVSSRLGGMGDGGAAASSVLNLHLLTGQLCRAGAGPMFLTATASGRGAFDAGATPVGLPGGAPAVPDTPPQPLVGAWGATAAREASRAATTSSPVKVLQGAADGQVPVLLLLGGTVTAHVPNSSALVEGAMRAAFVAATVGHLEDPDAAWADLLLPHVPWPQRECHFVSAERRVLRSLPCVGGPAGMRTELEVLARIGATIAGADAFPFTGQADAMAELKRATEDAPADMSQLPLAQALTDARGVQWPVATATAAKLKGVPRRYLGQDGLGAGFPTPTGKAVILPREHKGLVDAPTPGRPFVAVVSVDGDTWWDGLDYVVAGGDVERARDMPPSYVEIASADALGMLATEGTLVRVSTERGGVEVPARIAPEGTAAGHVFLPWGGAARVGVLPPSAPLDRNGTPPWTAFAVSVERIL
jgi:ferredoxin-nitrate reductase